MKALELARPTLPSISSSAPRKSHLPASEQDHDELDDVPTGLKGIAVGVLGQPRIRLDH